MKTKIRAYDVVNYLETEQDMAEYLEAAFEDGDPTLIATALGDVARAKGIIEISRQTGISRAVLTRASQAQGKPTNATIRKVIRTLGIKLQTTAIAQRQTL